MEILGHRILIKPDEIETVSEGGIFLVQDERKAKADTVTGTVIGVGPTAYKDPGLGGSPWVQAGDKVLYAKYGGKFYKNPDDGIEYVILIDEDIICKV